MEALTIAASVAGLVGLGQQIFSTTWRYGQAVRHADKDIASFMVEVRNLLAVLEQIKGLSEKLDKQEKSSTAALRDAMNSCKSTLDTIDGHLQASNPAAGAKTRFRKIWKRFKWPFSSSTTKDLIKDLDRHKGSLSLAMQGHQMSLSVQNEQSRVEDNKEMQNVVRQAMLEGMEKVRVETAEAFLTYGSQQRIDRDNFSSAYTSVTTLSSSGISDDEKNILEAFMQIDSSEVYETMLDLITPGTIEWIFDDPTFLDWLSGRDKVLWLKGGPGTGKTVLAAGVVGKLIDDYTDRQDYAIAFFICRWSDRDTQDKGGAILSSFAAQLANQSTRGSRTTEGVLP
jgi:hypothetical protein